MVENIAGRAGEQFEKVALPFEPERTQAVSDLGGIEESAEIGGEPLPCRQIGRRTKRKRAQNVGQALEPRLIGVEPLGVAGGELGDLGLGAARRDLQIAPVRQGQEVRQRALDDAEPMAMKIEVADDFGFRSETV